MTCEKPIAIFISSMQGGGAQRSVVKLGNGLVKSGYTVDLVLVHAEGPYLAEVDKSVRIIDLKASRVFASIPALVRYLRREKPFAMLSALNYVNIVALLARRLAGSQTRLIVSERNNLSMAHRHATKRQGQLMPRLVKWFYPWADGIVAVSKGVADDLVEAIGLSPERIQTIYNPIITSQFQQKAQAPLAHPWFGPGQPPVIVAVGRLTEQKDYPTLIRAFAQIYQAHQARLLILGDGDDRPKLGALIKELKLEQVVQMPGFIDNPYPYMREAALFVLSSRWEGLPGVLIEALYCGSPIVATDCPNGPREILADGRYGRLVPVGDIAALAQAMDKALTNPTEDSPEKGWYPFEMDTVIKQYLKVLLGD